MSVVALSIIIPTALILISLIVSAAGEQQVPLLGNVGPLWSADHRHIAGVFVYLSKKEWSFYSPAHLHLFNQSSSTYGRTPLSTRHMDALGVIVDVNVRQVPHLPPGDYVLGWRWDCEESTQVRTLTIDTHTKKLHSN